jgi:hypothetical protein
MRLNCTLEEMVEDYFKSTGKVALDGQVIYDKEKGFATYIHQGDRLLVPDVYGSGLYWLAQMESLAKSLHCTKLIGGTTRNVKAYNKLFGTKIIGYILEKEI